MFQLSGIRPPAVAGTFYPAEPRALGALVDDLLRRPARPKRSVLGVLVPHAGYVYSGALCGRALACVEVPRRVLLLHTKHRPGGGLLTLAGYAQWQTPLGSIVADEALSGALAELPLVTVSNAPHHEEHAAEVVLPFLQRLRQDLQIAVLSVGDASYGVLEQAAIDIAAALPTGDVLVVASSDMNHYEDHERTLEKDALALDSLRALDARRMLEVCDQHDISMCGAAATALMLEVCQARGGSVASVLEHTTSAKASGDFDRTVGYATALIW